MAKFGKALIKSMKQAARHAAGNEVRTEPIGKTATHRRAGKVLSPHSHLNSEPRRTPMRVRKVSP